MTVTVIEIHLATEDNGQNQNVVTNPSCELINFTIKGILIELGRLLLLLKFI